MVLLRVLKPERVQFRPQGLGCRIEGTGFWFSWLRAEVCHERVQGFLDYEP